MTQAIYDMPSSGGTAAADGQAGTLSPDLAAKYARLREDFARHGPGRHRLLRRRGQHPGHEGGSRRAGRKCCRCHRRFGGVPAGRSGRRAGGGAAMGVTVTRVRTHEFANPHFSINTPTAATTARPNCSPNCRGRRRSAASLDRGRLPRRRRQARRPSPRPAGRRERGVRSPLREAGMSKAEVRALALHLGVPNWDKPSFACLSSRFPYGTSITAELLAQLDGCEKYLCATRLPAVPRPPSRYRRPHRSRAAGHSAPGGTSRADTLASRNSATLRHARPGRLSLRQDERHPRPKI